MGYYSKPELRRVREKIRTAPDAAVRETLIEIIASIDCFYGGCIEQMDAIFGDLHRNGFMPEEPESQEEADAE